MSEGKSDPGDFVFLYADGASSGNPGPAGIGVVLVYNRGKLTLSEYIGHTTNNVAEYTALLKALRLALSSGFQKVKIMLDSELVVKQLTGEYRVKNERLREIYREVKHLLSEFSQFEVKHIPRELNAEADKLARDGIKGFRTERYTEP